MNAWALPMAAEFGGMEYKINADFRDVLEIIDYLTDEKRPEFLRWQIALGLFYDGVIPHVYHQDAMKYLADFISYGEKNSKPGPKLIDWQLDANMIVADINKVAGKEIRALSFLHWWTFLSYFYGIGEGQLSTVVSIRSKKAKGKKLEKWEQEYYSANKSLIDLKHPETEEIRAEKESILKWL